MKKMQIFFMTCILIFLVSCGRQATTSDLTGTTNGPTTDNGETTTSATEFVGPFGAFDFIRHLEVSDAVLGKIAESSRRIAYLDEEMYIYYEEGISSTSFFVFMEGETTEYDTHQSMGYADFFVMNFDDENKALYYYDDPSISSVPSVLDEGIDLYATRRREILYVNSGFLLVGNQFITFRGENLFSDGGVLVFPSHDLGENFKFYTYESNVTETTACSIKSYHGFDDDPDITLVHEEFTCGADYRIYDQKVVIELFDASLLAGYATITPDGEIHVMDFAAEIPDFDTYGYDSLTIVNDCLISFEYEDAARESHYVVVNFDLTNMTIDELSSSIVSKCYYADQDFRFYRNSSTEYRLYRGDELFYTYTPRSSSFTTVQFDRAGEFGVIYEVNVATGDGRLTRITLSDGAVVSYDKPSFSVSYFSGNYMMMDEGSACYLYDISNDEFFPLGVSGVFREVNEDFFLLYSDDHVYLIDFVNRDVIEMNRIGHLRRSMQPYAFLVEYQGEYYLIG